MEIDTEELHQTRSEIKEVEDKIHHLISTRDKLQAKLEELQNYDVYIYWDDGEEDKWAMSTDVPYPWIHNIIKMKMSDAEKLYNLLSKQ